MKNLFTHLITMQRWLRKNTMEAAKRLSSPTVTRRSTDGQSPERRPVEAGRAASAEKGQPITLHYLYRYAAMMALLLTLACGQMWGASVAEGTYNFVNQTIGAVTKFYKIDNGIYQYRLNAYTRNTNLGIQLPSGTNDGTGFAFYLASKQKVYIGIVKKSVKREVTNNLYVKTITKANFDAIEAGSNNSTTVTLTLGESATLSADYTFAAIGSAKTEGATVYMGELPAGYYYAYGNSSNGEGNLYSITFGTQTLFLVPNDKTGDNAKFAIYYWMGATGYERSAWTGYMTVSPCNASTYSADIPKGYTKLIYVRLDPDGGINWDSKWNQTGNLTFDGSKDLFTWASGSWDGVTTTWSASTKYTISFAANGGSGSMSNVSSIACGRSVTLAANAYEKSGYVFAGWKTNVAVTANGESVAANGIVDDEATISNITSNITLTAQWNEDVVCSATQPGTITKGTLSGCTLRLTAGGSPASNNTWYWQSSASGTDKSDAYSSGKAITAAGTYYLRSFCSDGAGCWSDAVQVTITAADMTPAAPSALAAASPTAKGVTLTVTDAANTNDYEFYVNTSSSAPGGSTPATHSSNTKSITITNLYAGTTFYAWARAKCGSNKSGWTALTGNTFTTSTVNADYHLTNVTKSSGATTGIGGSTFTAEFAAVSGYSLPDPTVTIGGNSATSGTDYTWNAGTGTLTINANKINGDIDITMSSPVAAPSSVAITGNWLYFAGETIELTATPTGGNGPVTYQWYKGGKENGNAIEGATTATYTKATCAFDDAGSYYCKVTCGGSQSTWGQSGDAYNVKIPRLYVKTGRNDGVKSDFGNVDFTRATASTATASIVLGSNWDYCFNIADGCGQYYGNAGTMQYNNFGPWVTNVNNQDCGLRTTNGAAYVFTIDYSNWEQLKTTVTFPSSNQAADKIIYFDNQTVDWSTLHYRIGRADHTQVTPMTKVPGTNNLYTVTTAAYSNAAGWHIANNTGWTGSNSIYRTYTNGDEYSITYATAHEGGAVTESAVTVTPTTSRGMGGDAGINDNCEFYNYTITNGMKTQNVAISPYSNGTITVNYTNTSNVASTLTSGNADLAHSVILTSITATPNTGYDAGAITINGGAYSANYVVTGATTIAASFTPHVYTITLNKGEHGAADQSATVAYLAGELTSITHVTPNTGYTLTGYYDGETKVLNANGTFASANVTGYITDSKWTKTSNATLTAKWECVSLTVNRGGTEATPAGGEPVGTPYGTLTCSASTGVIASYQWKQNTTASTEGAVNAVGTGATSASFSPNPAAAGTYYYYCVATDACGNSANTSFSGVFQFNEPADPCSEPTKVANEIARFFVPCGTSTAAWSTTADASTGDNSFTTSGFGGTGNNWYTNATSGLIYGKFQSSTYIIIKLKSGSFQAGDVVTAYFNLNSGTKTGLKLKDKDSGNSFEPTASASDVETSGTYTLKAADIENDGSIKFFRTNSSTYVNRIIVTRPPVAATITATKTSPDYVSPDPNNLVLSISTTGASSGWYYRVKKVDGGYQDPDNTPYNTATWTMTSGLTLGANNFVVELYNGSGERQAESATITVTAETAYSMTIAAGAGGSASPASTWANGDHLHPEITATPSSGYHFVNWNLSNANATLANASSATTTITSASGACTITANFEADDACPTGGDIFTLVMDYSSSSATKVPANSTLAWSDSYGDVDGGTVTLGNKHASSTDHMQVVKTNILKFGGNDGYVKIDLDCPLKTGDIISFTSEETNQISFTKTDTRATSSATSNKKWTVTAAYNNVSTIYLWRASGSTVNLHTINITRPVTVTFDKNGGSSVSPTSTTYDGTAEITLPEPVRADYRCTGWNTAIGGDGTDLGLPGETYRPNVTTNTQTIYAQWEAMSCESGTLYKFLTKTDLTNGDLSTKNELFYVKTSNYLANLTGGRLQAFANGSNLTISDDKNFKFNDNSSYLLLTLDCPLRATDHMKWKVSSQDLVITKTSTRATTITLTKGDGDVAVPEGLVGATQLWIWKGSSSGGKISYFEITRSASTYNVTYDGNDQTSTAGTVPTDATNYAYNATVTTAAQGSLAKTNYTFGGWNTANDGTGTNTAAGSTFSITDNTTLYAKWTQAVTFDANTAIHGSTGGSATAVWNATGLTGITHATPVSGYRLLGYYTTASGDGVKVLNSDGTFAATNVTDYITSGKWSRTGAAPTLYARYESSGSLIWNLGVNTEATSLTTSSKNSDFTQIAGSNMTNAALTGISYSQSKKSELTGVIETPTSYDGAKYVSVTFQVAAGYKFTPSSVNVKVQPKDNAKTVKLELSDASSHSQSYTSGSQSAGSIHTVTMTGNGTFYTGTVTLKIYCYGASGGYRLGTPISIEGEVEATCTMPSFDGLNYEETSYSLEDDASAITVTNHANVTTYAWKQNTTNDRSGTTPASGTNNTASYTPPTSAAGTLYYWCELTNDCGTVKTPAVGITVSATKSDATISWTGTSASANYGGGGYTVKATVNETGWNGNEADLTLSAPAGIRIYSIVSGTADSKKYVQASFDVTTAFDRETYSSTIPFTVSADATATYNAISDEHAVGFDACTGGGGAASEELMPVNADSVNSTVKGWRFAGTGKMWFGHGSSTPGTGSSNIKSLDNTMAGGVINKYYNTGGSYFSFYTEKAITGVRLYVYTSNSNVEVSNVYIANSQFATGTPSSGAVTYEVVYNDDNEGLDKGDNVYSAWAEITFDSEVAAGKYGLIKLDNNVKIAGIGLLSGSSSGAVLTTTLAFATPGPINDKTQSSANFTNAASVTAYSETLGQITYSSSNNSCATVNPTTGEVTITASGADDLSTTITATLSASGCYKSATATYTITIPGVSCTVNHGTLSSDVTSKCETEYATLTLTDFESDASVQWYNGETLISNGGSYTITTAGTTSTMVTKEEGTYSVMVTKDECSDRSNSITISNISATASVTKIVDEWYVKNGRLTPDIELWSLSEGATLKSVAWSPDNETGLSCVARGGVIYLEGKSPSSNESGNDIEYTLTATITDECNVDHKETTKTIKITHQKNTDKHVLAFVVTGTEKGGFTAGISAAQTTNVGLYNAIAAQFDVLATNIYATDDEKKLKEYYSQFDILCITDYPNTQTKGANKKSYVDAIGSLIDIRPVLTMEAFVSKLANWKAKGISGNPSSPTTRQYTMDLQCKDHEIFARTELTKVGEGDEAMYRVSMVCDTLEDYKTLDATYGSGAHAEKEGYQYGKKPALQGFTFTQEMSDNDLLPIGLIDDGAGNPLQVGIERQHNMEARLMVLGINSYAMERLTDDGERVVINALNYLMKKNAEDIADCSTAFVGGAEGDTKNWDNANNWTGNTVPLPSQKVRILAECEVSSTVHALDVLIVTDGKYNHGSDNAAGKLTIKENGALIVGGKIQAASAPAYNRPRATTPDKLLIETSDEHQAALIFDNEEAETQATVNMYSLGRKPSSYQYQYFAVPMEVVPVNPAFANETHGGTGIYTYVYDEASSGWTRRKYYDDLFAFEGLGITTKSATAMEYEMTGNLASTATKEITLTHNGAGLNLVGNSWMAPIQIGALAEDNTDANITQTVYIYCAGRDAEGGAVVSSDDTETAGQWLAIPFEAAEFGTWKAAGKLSVIPAMQAFQIKVADEATLTLDYKKVVRGSTNDLNAKLRAPGRRMAANEVTMTNIRVADSKTHTDLSLFEGDRFSEAFDNGWEAEYMNGDGRSAKLYAETEAGQMAVAAMYDYEGTVVGFVPGQETEYTFSFMGEDNGYYLNDIKLQNSVRISEGETYTFSYEEGDAANRFYISRTPIDAPQTSTGVDNTGNGEVKARKFIYRDKMYILINGRVYSADGALVK